MIKFILLISDLTMLTAALALTLVLRYSGYELEYYSKIHAGPFVIVFIFWILAFYITNLYERRSLRNNLEFYSNLFRAGIFAVFLSIALFYLAPLDITPRTNLALFLGIFTLLILASRWIFNHIFSSTFRKPVLLVGANPQSTELAEFIQAHPQLGYRLIRNFEIGASEQNTITQISQVIEKENIDTIVISPEAYKMPELIRLFYKSLDHRVTFRNLASFYEQATGRVPLGAIDQIWFLENLTESSKRAFEMIKRGIDISLALILGASFIILLPFLALSIKITSPGPIFYRQKRVGQAGKIFEIIKMRTMYNEAEKETGAVWAIDDDPRITAFGRFLRKTRIDELPQLWNIFRGDMSFVGPRAERPEFHEKLKAGVPFYSERNLIKPGLSGWAQINYGYGASVADAAQKLQYDLYYIKHRSLVLDIGIILKTINISLRQAGR